MIKSIIKYACLLFVFAQVSCSEDFLSNTPTDAISDEVALSSGENMMLVLNGLHRMMYAQNPLEDFEYGSRSGQSYYLPCFDFISGEALHSSPGNGWHKSDLQWKAHTNATYTTTKALWFERYHFISSVNAIINAQQSNNMVIDGLMANVLAQSYAYRAYCYHVLVTTYAKGYLISSDPATQPGVPILFATTSPYESAPRSSVAEVYAQMESDIAKSLEYFKEADEYSHKSNISEAAAWGIKARIALSKGDWETAQVAANNARGGQGAMSSDELLSGFNTVDLSGVLWGGEVIDTETNYYRSYFYWIGANFNGTAVRTNPKLISKSLYAQIPATDSRLGLWLPNAPNTNSSASNGEGGLDDEGLPNDPNYPTKEAYIAAFDEVVDTYGITASHNTHPYMNVKFLNSDPGTIAPDDVIYMRIAEMILIEAEAFTMQNKISDAQDALAILASERDASFDKTAFATQESLLAQIKFQRKVELWGEGFGYGDHIRWDEAIDQTNSGASLVLYSEGFTQAKPSENDAWIWKIPQNEIDANPNLTEEDQN